MRWRILTWEYCMSRLGAVTSPLRCTRKHSISSLITNTRDQTSREWKLVAEHPPRRLVHRGRGLSNTPNSQTCCYRTLLEVSGAIASQSNLKAVLRACAV